MSACCTLVPSCGVISNGSQVRFFFFFSFSIWFNQTKLLLRQLVDVSMFALDYYLSLIVTTVFLFFNIFLCSNSALRLIWASTSTPTSSRGSWLQSWRTRTGTVRLPKAVLHLLKQLQIYVFSVSFLLGIYLSFREILQEIQRLRLEHEQASQPTPEKGQQNPTLLTELRLLRYD